LNPGPELRVKATGAENGCLGDQLLCGGVEVRVVVLAVGAHERVRQLVHERLDAPVRRVRALDDDAFVFGR
jgi:hypothetical protein